MSWDVTFYRFNQHFENVDELDASEGDVILPLGELDPIHSQLQAHFPKLIWNTPSEARWEADGTLVEFVLTLEDQGPPTALHICVREAPAEAMSRITRLGTVTGWHGIDLQTGEFVDDHTSAAESLATWKHFRDVTVAQYGNAAGEEPTAESAHHEADRDAASVQSTHEGDDAGDELSIR